MQCLQINLRVDTGCVGVLMSQQRADLSERSTLTQHLAGQSMAELMCSTGGSGNLRAQKAMSNNRSDAARTLEATNGSFETQENTTRRAVESATSQICGDRSAHLRRQGHLSTPTTFAAHT